ncbi:2-(1,2-epoxy-1,2-dihydrophenyl)acetyl-CoA isomerase [bacterium]|nr:2-(1,2-epoxy-1,2-dihydrophenyl)acetyl-CoA isomerase [bacterium]
MDFNCLSYTNKDGVTTITLNRPDRFNAFNNEMSFELQDALKAAKRDAETRVIVLTGEGKAFCSGQDLKDIAGQSKRDLSESLYKRYNPIIRAMRNMPKPIICRLNGVAAGAGCSLALACDMIVASKAAAMIEVFINVGLVLDSGSSYFLPRVVGSQKAFEWATMGTKVSAEEAFDLGIVNRLAEPEDLDAEVEKITSYYAQAPTKAIAMIKKMLNQSTHSDLDTMLEQEAFNQLIAGRSKDYQEGVTAFVEKRKPNFTGE